MSRCGLALALLVAACSSHPARAHGRRDAGVGGGPAERPPAAGADKPIPLPAAELTPDHDGEIGKPGDFTLIAAADDGSWVALCQPGRQYQALQLVIGAGPGTTFTRLIDATDRDVLAIDGQALVHVDIPNRTRRWLGPAAHGAIDAASRRIVHARGDVLVVRDPAVPPRELRSKSGIATIRLHGKRWALVERGAVPDSITNATCGYRNEVESEPAGETVTVDLDPTSVEAPEHVGPAIATTAAGEITLDGAVVLDAACAGTVLAALANPPRLLATCQDRYSRLIGPGLDLRLDLWMFARSKSAMIDPRLQLGRRLYCESSKCVDLIDGTVYDLGSNHLVWSDDHQLVREETSGLLFDDLDAHQQTALTLPHVTQVVTVDSATGQRHVAPAPPEPAFIDQSGHFLLYGRYVIDLHGGTLVKALGVDALAVDTSGRVLVAAAPGQAPLRWITP